MRALLMDHKVPICCALMPQLVARATEFCRKHGGDTPPELMEKVLWRNFALDLADPDPLARPQMLALVGLVGKTIVAHCILQLQVFAGEFYAEVHQFQKDKRTSDGARVRLSQEEFEKGYQAFLEWARGMRVKDLRIVARNRAVAKVFRDRYGFVGERVIMKRAIWPAETTQPQEPEARVLRIAGRG